MANSIKVSPNPEALAVAAADFFVEKAQEAIDARERFIVSLSGGSTPKRMLQLLANSPYVQQIQWGKVYIFWGDERLVPKDHPDSNARMAKEALLQHVPIPQGQIFEIDGTLEPQKAAEQYNGILKRFFKDKLPVFDLFFLGLGEDGHTASLFPNTPVLNERTKWAKEVFLEKQNVFRVTITLPVINNAAHIAFLVSGNSKAAVLQRVLEGAYLPGQLPAQLVVRPENDDVTMFLDEDAAKELNS